MDIRERKAALRRTLQQQRAALDPAISAVWDKKIAQRVIDSDWFTAADVVFCYVSVNGEVDTSLVIETAWTQGKQVAVPRCSAKGKMDFFVINSREDLVPGAYQIPEPKEKCFKAESSPSSLCIVPGLSFDQKGFRIGYGGGYYDRYLKQFPGKSIGLVRKIFLADCLPMEEFDLAVDAVYFETE